MRKEKKKTKKKQALPTSHLSDFELLIFTKDNKERNHNILILFFCQKSWKAIDQLNPSISASQYTPIFYFSIPK